MDATEYIKSRLEPQQSYHSKTSSKLKKRFIILSIITLIASAIIPIITYFIDIIPIPAKILIALMSGISTIITSYLSISKTQELFVEYRLISEKLKSIEYLYQSKAPPFDNEDAFNKLVTICEDIIQTGNNKWHTTLTDNKTNYTTGS